MPLQLLPPAFGFGLSDGCAAPLPKWSIGGCNVLSTCVKGPCGNRAFPKQHAVLFAPGMWMKPQLHPKKSKLLYPTASQFSRVCHMCPTALSCFRSCPRFVPPIPCGSFPDTMKHLSAKNLCQCVLWGMAQISALCSCMSCTTCVSHALRGCIMCVSPPQKCVAGASGVTLYLHVWFAQVFVSHYCTLARKAAFLVDT